MVVELDQIPALFTIYGAGYVAIFAIYGALYLHARRKRAALELSPTLTPGLIPIIRLSLVSSSPVTISLATKKELRS